MRNLTNRKLVLASRPVGIPGPEHFRLEEEEAASPGDAELLVRNIYLSVDPAQRGWVNAVANYSEPVAIGAVMRAFAVGEVIATAHPNYRPGEIVAGPFGWQELAVVAGDAVSTKVDPAQAPISTALGVLGVNGITAYHALLDVGEPKAGETVAVSTGAGAVGSAVGQIAKIQGCCTIALTGSDDKVAQCLDLFGYDAAINYRKEGLGAALEAAAPDGIDVYFDNTAGAISDCVLACLAVGARIVICGTASVASWDPWPQGPRVERHLLVKRARMQGFLLFDYADRFEEARAALSGWIADGRLNYLEDIRDGLEAAPAALQGLYNGDNNGKMLIRVGAEPG